jgi:hypothetical protein
MAGLIQRAYGRLGLGHPVSLGSALPVSGGPSWIYSDSYDINAEAPVNPRADAPGPPSDDPPAPSVFTAVQQLGLKLEATRGRREFLVIDHIERPPEN